VFNEETTTTTTTTHPKKVSKKHPQSRWFRGNDFPQTLIIAAFVAHLGICFLPSFLPSLFCKIQSWCVA
jgi:hypothetical protein